MPPEALYPTDRCRSDPERWEDLLQRCLAGECAEKTFGMPTSNCLCFALSLKLFHWGQDIANNWNAFPIFAKERVRVSSKTRKNRTIWVPLVFKSELKLDLHHHYSDQIVRGRSVLIRKIKAFRSAFKFRTQLGTNLFLVPRLFKCLPWQRHNGMCVDGPSDK